MPVLNVQTLLSGIQQGFFQYNTYERMCRELLIVSKYQVMHSAKI